MEKTSATFFGTSMFQEWKTQEPRESTDIQDDHVNPGGIVGSHLPKKRCSRNYRQAKLIKEEEEDFQHDNNTNLFYTYK